jgi:hypothetical protein
VPVPFPIQHDPEKRRAGGRGAAKFLSCISVLNIPKQEPSLRAPRGKVGNLILVFHFSIRGDARLWECGNLALLARFPRGGGKRGKAACAFPLFPRHRHFHSPSCGPQRRASLPAPSRINNFQSRCGSCDPPCRETGEQLLFGCLHLPRRRSVGLSSCLLFHVGDCDIPLQVSRQARQLP